MKIQWSVISLLLLSTLWSCGKEQFATAPKSESNSASAYTAYSSQLCSDFTLIKPKVDVVYYVDNSTSTYYLPDQVKKALSDTVNGLSADFDFRVIGVPLIDTGAGTSDYQVMTNSTDLQGIPADSRRITTSNAFSFFTKLPASGNSEKGLGRVVDFINANKGGLIRNNAYLVNVLISNGRDLEVEEVRFVNPSEPNNSETYLVQDKWNQRLQEMRNLRSALGSLQLRLFSVTARTYCNSTYRTAEKSYVKMANQMYVDSGATDSSTSDSFDICSSAGISSLFSSINSSIKQVVKPHQYKYWPITFAENNETVSTDEIVVTKIRSDGSKTVLTRDVDWKYEARSTAVTLNTRVGPNPVPGPGEPYTGKHFIEFTNNLVYPDCVLVTSKSRTEYFNYIVLPQKPNPGFTVWVRGVQLSQSSTNGWSDETSVAKTLNIKAAYPNAGDQYPEVIRTGFMIKLNGPANYYKTGESVKVNYVPAPI
jgi:hypothetical protein